VRCRDATASSFVDKVQGEVFARFHAVAVKCHSSVRNCEDEFFMISSLDVEENDEHALDFTLHVSRLFLSSLDFPCTAHVFFPEFLSNQCQGLRGAFSDNCAKFDAHSLSDPTRNRVRQDTPL
jgi:hypothetical protein